MAYDPYKAVSEIYNLKGQWETGNKNNDDKMKNTAASSAQTYYQELRNNGYSDIADKLAAADYTQAKSIHDRVATAGKTKVRDRFYELGKADGLSSSEIDSLIGWNGDTGEVSFAGRNIGKPDVVIDGTSYVGNTGAVDDAYKYYKDRKATAGMSKTRDYLYSLGKADGMTPEEMDKLIEWDNITGEVSFGGKKIGKPDMVVDGTSYWSNTDALKNAYNDYMHRSGEVPKTVIDKVNQLYGTQISDHNDLVGMYKDEIDYLKNTNPFTTAEAKAIMGKYDLSGLQARDNATAVGAASNGGNIDSYAAANAMRQQASLVNQGQMAVLDAHQQKLDHAKGLLSDLGIQMRDNYTSMHDTIGLQQTEEQRQFDNTKTISDVTGYVPDEWVASNNPYIDENGNIKEQYKDDDFSDIMAKAKAAGNDALYNYAAQARFYKIMGDYGAYGQYDDGNYNLPGQQRTAAYELEKEGMASAERIAAADNQTQKEINASNNKSQENIASINANAQKYVADQNLQGKKYEVDAATGALTAEAIQQIKATMEVDALLNELDGIGAGTGPKQFVNEVLIPKYGELSNQYGGQIPPAVLQTLLETPEYLKKYNIDVEDARIICNYLKIDTEWLDGYRDRTADDFDGLEEGANPEYSGMIKK